MIDAGAVERLRVALLAGGVAIVPTDTVYGLAAALDSPDGVDALYRLKGRPRTQPCQVLVYSGTVFDEMLIGLESRVRDAARALLPGQATCIVADPAGRYAAASAGAGSVGIRYPAMDGPLAGLDIPLVATSANDPGEPDPDRLTNIDPRLRAGVAMVLDVGTLPGTASAVVDLRPIPDGGDAILIRPGPDAERVRDTLSRLGLGLRS